jgi:hypothetical protein
MARPRVQEVVQPQTNYENKVLQCRDCPSTFTFNARDQKFYALKGFTEPKRCHPCREINKQKQQDKPPSNRPQRG